MPQLLTLPYAVPLSAVGLILPGAKLSFFVSGTSTPQPVYQDIGLQNAHTQPIEADGAGRFPAIYLDPALPSYRILLTDSADVTLPGYPIDNVPSNQNTSQQFRLKHTAPEILFEETDATSGNQKWRIRANAEKLLIELLSDDEGTVVVIAELTRTGMTPGSLNFAGQFLRVDDELVATQRSANVAAATLTGVSGTVTGQVLIRSTGTKTAVYIPSSITGTSVSTDMSLTGLGTLMALGSCIVPCYLMDAGTNQMGIAIVGASSISFATVPGGTFTASGTKGLPGGTLIVFDTDVAGVA